MFVACLRGALTGFAVVGIMTGTWGLFCLGFWGLMWALTLDSK